jgi:hypothetical protein
MNELDAALTLAAMSAIRPLTEMEAARVLAAAPAEVSPVLAPAATRAPARIAAPAAAQPPAASRAR